VLKAHLSFATAVLLALGARVAAAQTATPLDRFEPAPAGDPLFAVPSPSAPGKLTPNAAVVLSYAHAPLVVSGDVGGTRKPVANIVDYQLTLHGLLSLHLVDRLNLEADVPAVAAQSGQSLTLATGIAPAPTGGALSDIRLGGRGELIQAPGISIALAGSVWLPTGNASNYTSAGVARFAPALIVGGDSSSLVWSTTVGARLSGSTPQNDLLGNELYAGLGAGLKTGALTVGPELWGSSVIGKQSNALSSKTSSLEALLGLHYRTGVIVWGGAGAAALVAGVGAPNYRLLASIAYAPESEKAPAKAEMEPAPPPPAVAAAPETPPPAPPPPLPPPPPEKSPEEKKAEDDAAKAEQAASKDQDGDGIPDIDDKCPKEPGVTQTDPSKNGCPQKTGPEKVVPTIEVDTRGCPVLVEPTGVQGQLMQPIEFDYRKDSLRGDAWPILRHVLGVMLSHPEVKRFSIDGHTDDTGSEPINLGLSKLRAKVVYDWLVQHGVPAYRLETRAFALYCPRGDNTTDEGRQQNRRVEFRIAR
jgi:outer membrane protein OmpA-like peptidoglycan-associated protein